MGFAFFLFIIALGCKLLGFITWSWWVVTLPLWIVPTFYIIAGAIELALGILGGVVAVIVMCVVKLLEGITKLVQNIIKDGGKF